VTSTLPPATAPFHDLSPDVVLGAVESRGLACDGRLLALNSFENRVYQAGLESGGFCIVKFYRPGRWSQEQLLEEHAFAAELVADELPVVAPMRLGDQSLFEHHGYRFALYERRGGRAPELEGLDVAEWMGRLLARIHLVGARRPFVYRAPFDLDHLLDGPADAAIRSGLMPDHLIEHYEDSLDAIAESIDALWQTIDPVVLRLHGDCHPGNVLWTDHGPHFVDLDDCRSGFAIQDLWMLMTGNPAQRVALLKGYETFRPFDRRELKLIEALKLLRQIHHAGWIAERIDDPAFPLAFPFALEPTWWEVHVNDLRQAAGAMAAG